MEKKNPIEEAKRYLANAKEILRNKAKKDGDFYQDGKYTRMAGNCMWNGCLIALKPALGLTVKRGQRLDIDDFKEAASKRDKKLLSNVVEGYNIMHLSMGYDGTTAVGVVSNGVKVMGNIIAWCEANAPKPVALSGTKTSARKRTTKRTKKA